MTTTPAVTKLLSDAERHLYLAAEALRAASLAGPDPRFARLLAASSTRAELVLLSVRGLRMTPEAEPRPELTVSRFTWRVTRDGASLIENVTRGEAAMYALRVPGSVAEPMPGVAQVQDEQYPTPARPVTP